MFVITGPEETQDAGVAFLLGSIWLALSVWVAEHGHVLIAAVLCGVVPARTLVHRPAA
ncbi:hypothetical protein [Geodermatophilus normandii]|uniref:Uncharacterized protein n=1 Tax=Geodermatophilus normandii TaxID=1137989 RepID=A0A6P0GFE6_9ACTN|nr:hypothetical protein [Geodermatophilus normandii]NEM05951.1 hypothetical protein [Geodermatophilus normandii]